MITAWNIDTASKAAAAAAVAAADGEAPVDLEGHTSLHAEPQGALATSCPGGSAGSADQQGILPSSQSVRHSQAVYNMTAALQSPGRMCSTCHKLRPE